MGCEAASEPCSSCATTANVGSTAGAFDYARGSTAEANADVFAITGKPVIGSSTIAAKIVFQHGIKRARRLDSLSSHFVMLVRLPSVEFDHYR